VGEDHVRAVASFQGHLGPLGWCSGFCTSRQEMNERVRKVLVNSEIKWRPYRDSNPF
jgi:hypothetical protein